MTKPVEVISEPQVSTTAQIQDFLKLFINLSGFIYVDDDNYVRMKNAEGEDDYIEIPVGKDGTPKYPNFALHKFSVNDVMRSDVVKDVLRAYEGE